MIREILEATQSTKERQEVIQKVKELLEKGECVYSALLGRFGKVTDIDEKGGISLISQKCIGKKTISPNCRGYTSIASGDPVYLSKEKDENGCWVLSNWED